MDQNEAVRALKTYEDLAGRSVATQLRPELSDDAILEGCREAARRGMAAVVVRPSDVDAAARALEGSGTAVASVAGFPHGTATTAVKVYEARDLLRRGVEEVHLTVNLGKLISRQFQYIETEVLQIARACHENGALLAMTLESAYLTEDLKVIAMKIAKRCEADLVKTSHGFGPQPELAAELELMNRILRGMCRVEIGGGIESLDEALTAYSLGAERLAGEHAGAILDAWKARLEEEAQQKPVSE